jgi:type I restriction enzyme S subunit
MDMNVDGKRSLPEGWVWTTLGEVSRINFRSPKLRELVDDFEVTFLPMAAVDEVLGRIAEPQVRRIGEVRKGYTPFSEGDVLFAKITPSMENGKAAIARGLCNGIGFGSTEFHVISPKPNVLAEYVFYFIRQITFREDAKANFAGTAGQLRVGKEFLESYEIPLAPLAEQERIVAEVEKQFTRLDAAVSALRRVQGNLARYKAAVLKAACEGRLVAQDPNDEPASELLARILAERRRQWEASGKKGKYQEPVGVDVDAAGLPELPSGWVLASLEAISDALGGYAFRSQDYSDRGYQVLKIGNVKTNRLELAAKPSCISEVEPSVVEKYLLARNDVVITLTGTRKKRDYGFVAIVKNESYLLLNQRVARLRFSSQLNADYCLIALQSRYFQDRFFSYETGNVGQGNVGMAAITKEPIAVPPILEQKRIVDEVERRLSVVQTMEQVIEANLARAERLRQTILQRAFSGQLVAQDPNDDPAGVVVEEIQLRRGDDGEEEHENNADQSPVQLKLL